MIDSYWYSVFSQLNKSLISVIKAWFDRIDWLCEARSPSFLACEERAQNLIALSFRDVDSLFHINSLCQPGQVLFFSFDQAVLIKFSLCVCQWFLRLALYSAFQSECSFSACLMICLICFLTATFPFRSSDVALASFFIAFICFFTCL